MGKIKKYSLPELSVINENVKLVIGKLEPKTISTTEFKNIIRYFSGLFSSKADDLIATQGECDMSDKYTEMSESLKFLFDIKSLRKLAERKPELFALMYMREDSFRELADKLLSKMIIVNEKESNKNPEVAEGKITQFPSHSAREIQQQVQESSHDKR